MIWCVFELAFQKAKICFIWSKYEDGVAIWMRRDQLQIMSDNTNFDEQD